MNFQFYLEKLKKSDEYKKFIRENPGAYFCSGFFSIDKTGNDNKQHFDFYVPIPPPRPKVTHSQSHKIDKKAINEETKLSSDINNSANNTNEVSAIKRGKAGRLGKIFSFQLEDGFKIVPLENLSGQVLDKLSESIDFDFEEVEKMVREKMQEEKVDKEIQKILFSLQKLNEKNFIVGTVFISGLGLVKINIDLEDKKVTDFEKKSFFDMLRKA